MSHVRTLLLAALVLAESRADVAADAPFYEISAKNLYDAGLQLGRQAGARMKGWYASPEMSALRLFAQTTGQQAFDEMKRTNEKAFPQYVREMRGLADGAEVSMDDVWLANLISELEALMPNSSFRNGHCSDIFAISADGYAGGFSHGHNEDWPGVVKDYWYLAKYTALPGADFNSCAGMAYPGTLIGWAATWNEHGMYSTQNSLFAKEASAAGFAGAFVQREAMCGLGQGRGMDEVLLSLTRVGWSYGASTNIIDLTAQRMANVETADKNRSAILEVSESMGNYSHFNNYKHSLGVQGFPEASTLHRQARVDTLPAPRTHKDVMDRLSDVADKSYPLFRNMTLATLILDGKTGQLDVWCCGNSAAGPTQPIHSWNILNFWRPSVAINV